MNPHHPAPAAVKTAGAGRDFTTVSILTRNDYDIDFLWGYLHE